MAPARRWLAFLSAAIAAVLAVVLPVTIASAAGVSAAGTRVGASHPGMIFTVGATRRVSAGEGRCEGLTQPGFVSGLCVAAEENTSADSCVFGGQSFTPATKVLTASGALVAISKLRKGEKVLATNTKTGKTRAETVAAVLVHHDTDRYDLKISTGGKTAVIHTTRSHLFWDASSRRWVKAAALRHGMHLRTSNGATATVIGGHNPKNAAGWMWDLTITTDHDFYIKAATTTVLVHNIDCGDTFTVRAGDLANPDKVSFSHPVNDAQLYGGEEVGHGGVANLSNDDLVTFGGPNGDDPITGYKTFAPEDSSGEPASDINILAGHHRVFEIANRVNAGLMDPDTPVEIAIGEP